MLNAEKGKKGKRTTAAIQQLQWQTKILKRNESKCIHALPLHITYYDHQFRCWLFISSTFALASHIIVSELSRFNKPKRNESVHCTSVTSHRYTKTTVNNDKFPVKSCNNNYYRIHNGTVRSMIGFFLLQPFYTNDRMQTTMKHAELDKKI